jgi:NAD(P)-dependent dehydrogenase (short-subunit alcohol dehydrogenase family)
MHLVITGASTGIGRATVEALQPRCSRITLVGRSPERHREVLTAVPGAEFVAADLRSLRSVASAGAAVHGKIDVLIANAGVAGQRGITDDGFELHFGVNHLAHHLLVRSLAKRITDRIVIVSSNAHFGAEGIDYEAVCRTTRTLTGFSEYQQSKLANIWFGRELARRTGLRTHIVHPGVVASDIWRRIPGPIRRLYTRNMLTTEQGATTSVWAATTDGLDSPGYFALRAPMNPSAVALDDRAAATLWDRSEEWLTPFSLT